MRNQRKSLDETDLSPTRLMEIEADVLFTSDKNGRLLRVNEPWPDTARAARMLLTRPLDGPARCYFREDLPDGLIRKIEKIIVREEAPQTLTSPPSYQKEYVRLLGGEKVEYGPCYWMPDLLVEADVVFLSEQNVRPFIQNGFSWLAEEISYVAPCAAVIRDKQAVCICRSVRKSRWASEAGLETLSEHRGRGYAGLAAAAWAQAVRQTGRIPLYSTSWDNLASQRVAQKLGLRWYGVSCEIW